MDRRQFLKVSGLSAGTLLFGQNILAQGQARPNILLIMTDQQTATAMSCVGNPYVKTPNADRIAAAGVLFEKAYATSPLCKPFRTAMVTGKMPHETGVTDNRDKFSVPVGKTMGRIIKDAGYTTCYYGKWHIPISATDVATHGFDTFDFPGPNNVDRKLEKPCVNFINSQASSGKPWFLVASFVNPHDICEFAVGANYHKNDHRPGEIPGPIPKPPYPLKDCPPLPANHEREANQPTPLTFAQTDPVTKAHKHYSPVNLTDGTEGPKKKKHKFKSPDGTYGIWNEKSWRYYLYAYYRMVEDVDTRVGTLLDALETSGQDKNTVIIFCSDHGEGIAAHKWNQKTVLYEESVRVPFIISQKTVTGAGVTDSEHLISICEDMIPTMCDYAGVKPPQGLRGKSIRLLAEGKEVPWRDQVVAETTFYNKVNGRMLRTGRYKYTCYYDTTKKHNTQRELLIDMQADPGEMNNLIVDPASAEILKDMRQRLKAWCKQTKDSFPVIQP